MSIVFPIAVFVKRLQDKVIQTKRTTKTTQLQRDKNNYRDTKQLQRDTKNYKKTP